MTASPPRWDGVAFGLALSVLATFQQYKLPPVLPILLDRYGYDRVLAGGLMAVYAVCGLALSVRAGRALDRFGLRLVEVACLAFAAGSALGLALPDSGAVMLASRALEGLGYTVLAIAGPAIATRAAADHAVLVAGIVAAWVPIGQLLANAIAYPFADAGAWQPVWWAALAATLAVLGWTQTIRHAFGLGGAAAAAALDPAERRALVLASLVFLVFSGQYIGFMSWLNAYLVEAMGLGAGLAVGAASLAAFFVVVFNVGTGFALRGGLPIGPVFVGSLAAEALTWFAVPWLSGEAGLLTLALYGVACGMTPVCLFAMPALIVGRRAGATAFGVLMRGRNVGVLVGPLLVPFVAGRVGWNAVWPLYGGMTLAAAGCAWLLVRRLAAAAPRT